MKAREVYRVLSHCILVQNGRCQHNVVFSIYGRIDYYWSEVSAATARRLGANLRKRQSWLDGDPFRFTRFENYHLSIKSGERPRYRNG